jgi:Lrp/AsnC family leucine-responsive transcriptional regulator
VAPRDAAVGIADIGGDVLHPAHPPWSCIASAATTTVALERESSEHHAQFRRRLRAVAAVQQCYDVAGEWDYVVVLVTTGMDHCRELADRLFMNAPNVRRFDTLPVFEAVKTGLEIPIQAT